MEADIVQYFHFKYDSRITCDYQVYKHAVYVCVRAAPDNIRNNGEVISVCIK